MQAIFAPRSGTRDPVPTTVIFDFVYRARLLTRGMNALSSGWRSPVGGSRRIGYSADRSPATHVQVAASRRRRCRTAVHRGRFAPLATVGYQNDRFIPQGGDPWLRAKPEARRNGVLRKTRVMAVALMSVKTEEGYLPMLLASANRM